MSRQDSQSARDVSPFSERELVIYIVQEEGSDRIKIGYARDAKARIRQLQVANPRRLLVLDIARGTKADEAALHRRLKARGKHLTGEWFRLDGESREVLSAYSDGSLYQAIEREEALRRAGEILEDMTKDIRRLQKLVSKKR
jgi:hypothetical protein